MLVLSLIHIYGLDSEACKGIYLAKGRPSDNPLILHISQISELRPIVPVSYTHLLLIFHILKPLRESFISLLSEICTIILLSLIRLAPVSYTHLDVYKRQGEGEDADDRNPYLCDTAADPLEQIVGNAVRLAREKKISVPFIAAAYDKTLQTML